MSRKKAVAKPVPAKEPYRPCKDAMELCKILKLKRPSGTATESEFVEMIKQVCEAASGTVFSDEYGNVHVSVAAQVPNKKPKILFSAHTDTVHATDGEQQVLIDEITSQAFISTKGQKGPSAFGECLGADDGTGCWIMLNMIRAAVPGYYIFHRDEEVGGKGSRFVADNWNTLFTKKDPFDIAVAFDRKGTNEVITHQRGQRLASDKSGNELITLLDGQGLKYVLSDRGSFTDTANYGKLVPECYNLAVGYDKQHGPNETQNLPHAVKLMRACINMDWSSLQAYRDPTKVVYKPKKHKPVSRNTQPPYQQQRNKYGGYGNALDTPSMTPDTGALIEFVTQYPMAALLALHDLGVTESDIVDYITRTTATRSDPRDDPYDDYRGSWY